MMPAMKYQKLLVPAVLALSACSVWGSAQTQPAIEPTTRPIVQADNGSILLHARDVTIHGTVVRYEPDPHKNTIGFWTRKDDWVSWDFEVTVGGRFQIDILQGCGKGSGGSVVEFLIDDQEFKITVEETGGFQNFLERTVGVAELSKGRHTLSVKPVSKPGLAVMDLRQVVLKPVNP